MIARRVVAIPALAAAALSLVAAGCDKVPLLAPTGSTITLTSAASALPANASTTIIAQVLEAAGTPPQDGTLVTFLTTLGSIEPAQAETSGGRVTVRFNSGSQSGTATITAASGGATVGANGAIRIAIGSAAVGGIALSATPPVVPSTGGNSTIAATVVDSGGNPLSGIPVSFTTDAGSVSPTVATTDASGNAQTTLTTSRTAKVTATAGVAASTTGTGGATTTTAAPSATVTVTVNATQGIAIGTAAPASPTAGQTVSLPLTYATASGASPITQVRVDWGDGSAVLTYSGQPGAVSHSYATAGSYLVQVSGLDSFGDKSTTSTAINVGPKPRVVVTITPPATAPTPNIPATFTIAATASGTGNVITSMTVSWGDGTSSPIDGNATSATHIFTAAGTYTVTVTATDSAAATGSASTIVVVVAVVGATPRVIVAITPPTPAPTQNSAATFTIAATASGTGNVITSMTVSWGDGTSSPVTGNATSATHIFTAAGTYTVTVTATDSAGATGSASTIVVVGGGLVAKFTFSPTSPSAGQQVSFNASDSTLTGTVASYAWDFGDGDAPSRSVPTISHAFAVAGVYKVRLTIIQSNGQTATTTNDVTVK